MEDWRYSPEHKVINDLFGNDIIYTIPDYQRPYSWECIGKSDKNNQVNLMWDDLISFFKEESNQRVYFLGSMVLIGKDTTREYQVIDGQQRLTTLVLLFVAIKCFLEKMVANNNLQDNVKDYIIKEAIPDMESLIFNRRKHGATTVNKKVRIERGVGFDYDKKAAQNEQPFLFIQTHSPHSQ